MTQAEFTRWREFYAVFPFDDLHRVHRPAALVASALGGGDLQRRLDWLQPPATVDGQNMSAADLNTLRAFGFRPEDVQPGAAPLRKDH
jgi:hypothetical protein